MKHIPTFESFLNEAKSQEWIVFLPIQKGDTVDIDDSLFGAYNDEEYDRIASQYLFEGKEPSQGTQIGSYLRNSCFINKLHILQKLKNQVCE